MPPRNRRSGRQRRSRPRPETPIVVGVCAMDKKVRRGAANCAAARPRARRQRSILHMQSRALPAPPARPRAPLAAATRRSWSYLASAARSGTAACPGWRQLASC